ncbi:FCD domain-containing protein [Rhodobacterales bacterium HKCCE2091]|nr:FCD domain-containing protein [Rhodobacterales bacterium HKCCE2091]
MVIEPPAAEMLARESDPAKIAELNELLDRCSAAVDNNATYGELTAMFHRRIVDLSGIKTLGLLNALLHDLLARSNAYVWSTEGAKKDTKVRKESSIKARRTLVKLIEDGKPEEAREYALVSLRNVADILDKWGSGGRIVDVLKDWP